ncbi:MAG TPA: hypothetical protein EYP04_05985 [Anaerolineae bacterium]|nr:hypothetical protein [Anaerolineae bacterium]HIQ04580.1 hypothetical protein [Anaerolineae bacterium]
MDEHDDIRYLVDAISRRIADLSEESLIQLSQFISYLKWREEEWLKLETQEPRMLVEGEEAPATWHYDFLAHFDEANVAATNLPAGMEVKVEVAMCGGVQRPAIWQHPPSRGEAVVEYHVMIPPTAEDLRLHFQVGVRDGAMMVGENFVAFRVYLNGRLIWRTTKQTNEWEAHIVSLPYLAGQIAVMQFVTDALGESRWNWAVWGNPVLVAR